MSPISWKIWDSNNEQPNAYIVPVDRLQSFMESVMKDSRFLEPSLKQGSAMLWYIPGTSDKVVLVNDFGSQRETQRTWAKAGHIVRELEADRILVWSSHFPPERMASAVWGLGTGLYEFKISVAQVEARVDTSTKLYFNLEGTTETHFHKCVEIAKGQSLARDWVNQPSNLKPPAELAQQFMEGSSEKITWSIMDESELQRIKAGGILAVGQGSAHPSAMLIGKYNGSGDKPYLGLVGKGITFDSGGLSLKPAEAMKRMKVDMGGAAAVAAALRVVAELDLQANVMAVIPLAENMTGADAFRPGDVLTMLDGTTVEVISTDAEGRLALGDALTVALREGATHLVDMATLTGANVVSLGGIRAGVVHNNELWASVVDHAANVSMEPVWILPNDPEYMELNHSGIADMKNSAGRPAGTITAGLFVGHFAHGEPWVHVDIAGMAYTDGKQSGVGATGFGVSLLVETCLGWSTYRN